MAVAVRQPRLLNENGWTEKGRLRPSAAELHLKLNGISYGVLTMGWDDEALPIRAWVEMYTSKGSAGLYRITRADSRRFQTCAYTVQHAIDTLNDSLWREQGDFTGNAEAFLRKLLSFQNKAYWQLGTCEDTDNYKLTGINYNKLSDMLTEFVESRTGYYLTYDFSTWPWTVNWKRLPAGVRCEWRVRRNVRSCSVTTFDTEQCTRVHYTVTPAEGQEADPTIHVLDDAEAQQYYGVIERPISISAEDVADPAAFAAQFLRDHAEPGVQINVEGYEFYKQTGDSLDSYDVGDLARCIVGGIGGPLRERIVVLNYPDLIGTPESVSGELANSLPKFSESLATASKTAAAASRSARASARAVEKQEKEITHWSQVVTYHGNALDETGITAFYESGIDMDATGGVKIFSLEEGLQALYASIQVNAKAIEGKVGSDALNSYLLINEFSTKLGSTLATDDGTIGASIATSVNAQTGDSIVAIDASKVNITGLVTMTDLEAVEGKIDTVRAETITAGTYLSAATGKFNTLWVESPGTGGTHTAQVNNAVNSIAKDNNLPDGQIGILYTTLANPTPQSVNFNIADTSYYRAHVGISSAVLQYYTDDPDEYDTWSANQPITLTNKYGLIKVTSKKSPDDHFFISINASSGTGGSASINNITAQALTPDQVSRQGRITIKATGTNVSDYSEDAVLSNTTYTDGGFTYPCVILTLDNTVIGRISTQDTYNNGQTAGKNAVKVTGPTWSNTGTPNTANTATFTTDAPSPSTSAPKALALTLTTMAAIGDYNATTGTIPIGSTATVSDGTNNVLAGTDSKSLGISLEAASSGSASAEELTNGTTYALKLTKDGSTTSVKFFKVPAAVTPATINVKKNAWSSGAITFETDPASGTGAGVSLAYVIPQNNSNGNISVGVVDRASPYSSAQPHTVLTKILTLTCGDDYAVVKDGNTTVAQVPNEKSVSPVTVNVQKGSWSSGAIQFTTSPASGTGANVSLSWMTARNESNGNANISVVDSSAPYSSSRPQTVLSKSLVLTCEDDAAYLMDGSKTIAKVPNNKTAPTISASIDMIELRTVGGVQYRYNEAEKDYTIYVQASGTNVSPKTDGQLHIGGSAAFTHGRDSVTITNVERIASCAYDEDAQTARQDVRFTLSNGETYTIRENFDAIYRAGRSSDPIDTTIEYAADLSSEGAVFDTVDEGLTIDVSDIYQRGQDYTPPALNWYIYPTTSSDQVDIYVYMSIISAQAGKVLKSTVIAFYPYTPVEPTGVTQYDNGFIYTQVLYNGSKYLVLPNNLKQFDYDISEGHRVGIKNLKQNIYPVSTTMTGLIHTGGAPNITVYLEPYYDDAKDYSSTYMSSADYASYRTNGNTGDYFAEMANKSGYYGRHEKTAYSGDIQHKAIFDVLYSDDSHETVIVSFNSYPKAADEVIYTYSGFVDSTSNTVPLYVSQSTSSSVQYYVATGATVKCLYNPSGYSGTWMPVQVNGYTGYMQAKYIEYTQEWEKQFVKNVTAVTVVEIVHNNSRAGTLTVGTVVSTSKNKFPRSRSASYVNSTLWNIPVQGGGYATTTSNASAYLQKAVNGQYAGHPGSQYASPVDVRVVVSVTYQDGYGNTSNSTECVEVKSYPYT